MTADPRTPYDDTPHADPCDCADCRAATEHVAELDFAALHDEGLA